MENHERPAGLRPTDYPPNPVRAAQLLASFDGYGMNRAEDRPRVIADLMARGILTDSTEYDELSAALDERERVALACPNCGQTDRPATNGERRFDACPLCATYGAHDGPCYHGLPRAGWPVLLDALDAVEHATSPTPAAIRHLEAVSADALRAINGPAHGYDDQPTDRPALTIQPDQPDAYGCGCLDCQRRHNLESLDR